jgi:hypothetical protein
MIAQALCWLYARLLRLYPRRFRDRFGDEMQAVFADLVRDSGSWRAFGKELVDLPRSVIQAHVQERWKMKLFDYTEEEGIRFTRWLTRIASLLTSLIVLAFIYDELDNATNFMLLIISLTMLAAWRWEIQGGQATLLLTVVTGIGVMGATYLAFADKGASFPLRLFGLLIGSMFMVPWLAFGWLFYQVGRRSARLREVAR